MSMTTSFTIKIVGLVLLCACPASLYAQLAPAGDRPAAPSSQPLPPQQKEAGADRAPAPGLPTTVAVVGALALVLGVFFVGVWLFRQAAPAGFGALPTEAFEPLGRARLSAREQVHLLRCGNKALLVASGTWGARTLVEIADPEEVERLTEACRRPRRGGGSSSGASSKREAQ